jgi:uncharacterized protein
MKHTDQPSSDQAAGLPAFEHPLPPPDMPLPVRWLLATIGVGCFVLGIIGALVPGMPTTIFLLLGSFFVTRSCPWIEDRMLAIPLLRPYATFIRSKEPMSRKARITALSMMWTSIVISSIVLGFAGKLTPLVGGFAALLGIVGTVSILMFRRQLAE